MGFLQKLHKTYVYFLKNKLQLIMQYKKLFETIRKNYNLNKKEMAEKSGITRQYLDELEKKTEPANLSKKVISKLQTTFNVNPNFLLSWQGEMFINDHLAQAESMVDDLLGEMNLTPADWELLTDLLMEDRELFLMLAKKLKNDRPSVVRFLFPQ